MAGEANLRLVTHLYTPFGQRVAIGLKEKNIPFEEIHVDVVNKPQILLDANPILKKVPAIIHNGKSMAESLVILQYLEDAFPERCPLLPTDPFERSQARFWMDYIDKFINATVAVLKHKPGTPENQAACEGAVKTLRTIDAGIASFSEKGPFFTGEKFGLVDVVLAPHTNTLALFQEIGGVVVPGPDELPRFHQWMKTVRAHPSVSSSLPPVDENVAYVKSVIDENVDTGNCIVCRGRPPGKSGGGRRCRCLVT